MYYLPETTVGNYFIFHYPKRSCYYHPHNADEETKTERG